LNGSAKEEGGGMKEEELKQGNAGQIPCESPNPKPQPVISLPKGDYAIISREPDRPRSWVGSQPL
jgi:hypothetical protein